MSQKNNESENHKEYMVLIILVWIAYFCFTSDFNLEVINVDYT